MPTSIDPAAVTRSVLPNGLTVLVYRNESAPVAAVNTYVRAGYFDEVDEVVGIAHVLEHMFFKGTERFGVGEIAKATKAAGGYLNAHTIYDHTSYYAVLPASGFAEGLEIQADAYARSVIDAAELGKELEVIIQEAMRKQDNAGAVTTETLYELLHDRHRIRRWRIGRPDALRKFTRNDLFAFYRNFYTPSNTILSIAGSVEPDEVLARVQQLYGALPSGEPVRTPGPSEPERNGFRYRELSGDVEQTQIEIGWRTVPAMHPDSAALDLTGSILGSGRASRLYRAVRDRQLAGSVSAYNYSPTEIGVFAVSSEGDPDRAADAARAMWAQVAAVRNGDVSSDEVHRAQQLFGSRWARHIDTAEGQAAHLAEWESLGGWEKGQEYFDAFMQLDRDAVAAVASKYLTEDCAAAVVYRSNDTGPIASDATAFRSLLAGPTPALANTSPPVTTAPSAPGSVTFDSEHAGVRVYLLKSGIPLLIKQRNASAITHIGIYAAAGSANETPEHAGITALAARSVTRATATRNSLQIAEKSELLGGSIGSSVSTESFGWAFSVPAPNVVPALELLADAVQHATLPADAVETERAAMLADLAQLRDDMYRYPIRLAQEAAYAGHPYSIAASGTEASLNGITVDEVREWYAKKMLRAPFVIAITGDVGADALAPVIGGLFDELELGAKRSLAIPQWPLEQRERRTERDKTQSAFALAFAGPSRKDERRYAAHLLSSIATGLGGRFFEELRDRRSLAYTVHAFGAEHTLSGMFLAYIATSPEREEEARAGLLAEFEKLRSEPVTPDELARAKRYLLGMHDIHQERGGAVLGDIVDAWLFGPGLSELEQFHQHTNAVSSTDILSLAQDYFDPARVVTGGVRGTSSRS